MEQIQSCDFWNNFFFLWFGKIYVCALQQIPWNNFLLKPPRNASHGKTFRLRQKQNITFWHLHYTWGDVNLRLRVANMHILTRSCGAYQGWAGIPVPGHSREYRPPIPVHENWEWFFHSHSCPQKLEMLFFIPVPIPKIWECNFPFLFPLPGMDYQSRE